MARPCWIHTSFLTPSRNTAPYGPETTTVNCRRTRATQLPSRAELRLQPSLGVVTAHTGTDRQPGDGGSVSARSPAWGSPGWSTNASAKAGAGSASGTRSRSTSSPSPPSSSASAWRPATSTCPNLVVSLGAVELIVVTASGSFARWEWAMFACAGAAPALRRPGEDVAAPRGAVRLLQHADHVGIAIDGTPSGSSGFAWTARRHAAVTSSASIFVDASGLCPSRRRASSGRRHRGRRAAPAQSWTARQRPARRSGTPPARTTVFARPADPKARGQDHSHR